jgi:hypothetical protein
MGVSGSKPLGLITVLHTFGKDIKFHPHLHILTNSNINFNSKFNKFWRRIVLNNLRVLSNRYSYGYYVWSEKGNLNPKKVAKYAARYVRHPAIANGRIVDYGKNRITFYYKDYNGDKIFVTKKITNFITSLVQHIPQKQFKMIRYYGVYARNNKFK